MRTWWIVARDIHRFAELDEPLTEIRDLADRLVAVRAYCLNDLPVVCQGEVEDVVDGVSSGVSVNSISTYGRTRCMYIQDQKIAHQGRQIRLA